MQGDISRDTFDRTRHFSTVVSLQGRPQLDADANEQAAILLHYLRTLATDLIGPAGYPREPGAPDEEGGFFVTPESADDGKAPANLGISAGRMYVDGILVENEEDTTYWDQPDGYLTRGEADKLPDGGYLVYLRVWERLITTVEEPAIREKALGIHGPDTSARSRVVWQVAVKDVSGGKKLPDLDAPAEWLAWLRRRLDRETAEMPRLSARAKRPGDADVDVCEVAPDSQYRGPENQLYRVEIHQGGAVGEATFKWSRENASVVLPIDSIAGDMVTLSALGRDGKLGLEVGDMVEVVDDAQASRVADDPNGSVSRLYRAVQIDHVARQVTLDGSPADEGGGVGSEPSRHPFLRRWDHQKQPESPDGAIPIEEEGKGHPLEDGVSIWFEAPPESHGAEASGKGNETLSVRYRSGDYWLIPARVVTGDVEWPQQDGEPLAQEPHGVEYHYAPLALVDSAHSESGTTDLRLPIDPLTVLAPKPPELESEEVGLEELGEVEEQAELAKKAAAKKATPKEKVEES